MPGSQHLRKIVRWIGYGAAGFAGLAIVIVVTALAWRAGLQWQNAHARKIASPAGIDELRQVQIGGIEQWIHIRGDNIANPILLYVHGGPGFPMMPFEAHFQRPLEHDFTVVEWDQRGAGKTYVSNGGDSTPAMTFGQMKADTHALTAYLKKRFHRPKIFILGHSWGSILALPVALENPQDYYAFIGTGVVINMREDEAVAYRHVLWEARRRNDTEAIAALESIAPYPDPRHGVLPVNGVNRPNVLRNFETRYGHFTAIARLDNLKELARYELSLAIDSPQYGIRDIGSFITVGPHFYDGLYRYMDSHNVRSLGMRTSLPIVFVDGEQDWQAPWPIAKRYIDDLQSPYKTFYLMPKAAHVGPVDRPELFAAILRAKVRPLAFGKFPPKDAPLAACRPSKDSIAPDGQVLDILGC